MSERTTASQAQALTRVSMARLRARSDRPKTGPARFPPGADDRADPGG
jgi:hypothetical protein